VNREPRYCPSCTITSHLISSPSPSPSSPPSPPPPLLHTSCLRQFHLFDAWFGAGMAARACDLGLPLASKPQLNTQSPTLMRCDGIALVGGHTDRWSNDPGRAPKLVYETPPYTIGPWGALLPKFPSRVFTPGAVIMGLVVKGHYCAHTTTLYYSS
ncbi:hypothetical protein CLAIMM_06894 isoform 2, partial [Cladophialophora immunda]